MGHLFRRRGEIERAIRVHENLLARPNLNEAQRHQALFSLAEDYLGAGLFDRAEQLFGELRDSTTLAEAALEKLVSIYEREQEWQKAIDAHRKLEMLRGAKSSQVAHYYCELAELARAAGDRALAREHLRNTVRSESGALRGTLIRADAGARRAGLRAGDPALRAGHRGRSPFHQRGAAAVARVLSRRRPLAGVRRVSRGARGERRLVASRPGLRRDHRRLERLDSARERASSASCSSIPCSRISSTLPSCGRCPAEQRAAAIERIADGLRTIALANARYRCSNCGYSTQRFIWHCPSCKLWETVRPIQSVPLETVLARP